MSQAAVFAKKSRVSETVQDRHTRCWYRSPTEWYIMAYRIASFLTILNDNCNFFYIWATADGTIDCPAVSWLQLSLLFYRQCTSSSLWLTSNCLLVRALYQYRLTADTCDMTSTFLQTSKTTTGNRIKSETR